MTAQSYVHIWNGSWCLHTRQDFKPKFSRLISLWTRKLYKRWGTPPTARRGVYELISLISPPKQRANMKWMNENNFNFLCDHIHYPVTLPFKYILGSVFWTCKFNRQLIWLTDSRWENPICVTNVKWETVSPPASFDILFYCRWN